MGPRVLSIFPRLRHLTTGADVRRSHAGHDRARVGGVHKLGGACGAFEACWFETGALFCRREVGSRGVVPEAAKFALGYVLSLDRFLDLGMFFSS